MIDPLANLTIGDSLNIAETVSAASSFSSAVQVTKKVYLESKNTTTATAITVCSVALASATTVLYVTHVPSNSLQTLHVWLDSYKFFMKSLGRLPN